MDSDEELPHAILSLAKGLEVPLSPAGAGRLATYLLALCDQAQRRNLSAARTVQDMLRVLVAPSLPLAATWGGPRAPRLLIDVGSGNGFPGVVGAALWPALRVLLVERRQRKAEAIEQAARGWEQIRVLALDARDIPSRQPEWVERADLVTFRAVGALADCNRIARPLLAPGGRVVHWKPVGLTEEERGEGASLAGEVGWRQLPDVVPPPPGTGRLVVYESPLPGG